MKNLAYIDQQIQACNNAISNQETAFQNKQKEARTRIQPGFDK